MWRERSTYWGTSIKRFLAWIWPFASVLALTLLVSIIIRWLQLGFPEWTGFKGQKLFHWLDILVVPFVVGGGVYWLEIRQRRREQKAQQERQYWELRIQEESAQDSALQSYLDKLTELFLEKQGNVLMRMHPEEGVREVVQARTDPLLRRLDATRRWSVVLFLSVVGLLERGQPLVSLAGADLQGVSGQRAPLRRIDLAGANLRSAHLEEADLGEADLRAADLTEAYLEGAHLERAHLGEANLRGATLRGAHLEEANLRGANLQGAYLEGAHLERADLSLTYRLSEAQIALAIGDETTRLPEGVKMPKWWNQG